MWPLLKSEKILVLWEMWFNSKDRTLVSQDLNCGCILPSAYLEISTLFVLKGSWAQNHANIKTSLAKSSCTPHILDKAYLAHFFSADIFPIFILLSSLLAFRSTSKLGLFHKLWLELVDSYSGSSLYTTLGTAIWRGAGGLGGSSLE